MFSTILGKFITEIHHHFFRNLNWEANIPIFGRKLYSFVWQKVTLKVTRFTQIYTAKQLWLKRMLLEEFNFINNNSDRFCLLRLGSRSELNTRGGGSVYRKRVINDNQNWKYFLFPQECQKASFFRLICPEHHSALF